MMYNSKSPLSISTYDGSFQSVHPCVIEAKNSFCGFRYWMAMTPYPYGNDIYENPSLRASHDGVVWEKVEHIKDPIVAQPSHNYHHSDPFIMVFHREMYLFYRTTDKINKYSYIYLTKSHNLKKWTDSVVVLEGKHLLSPSFLLEKQVWYIWYIDLPEEHGELKSKLMLIKMNSLEGDDCAEECMLDMRGYQPWHIEVRKYDGIFEAVVNAYPPNSITVGQELYLIKSDDGVQWEAVTSSPLITPSILGWDNKMIYKTSFAKSRDGLYRFWYSAASWGGWWGIGYLEGSLGKLKGTTNQSNPSLKFLVKMKQDLTEILKYYLKKILPQVLINILKCFR